jgi:hypothetical protein
MHLPECFLQTSGESEEEQKVCIHKVPQDIGAENAESIVPQVACCIPAHKHHAPSVEDLLDGGWGKGGEGGANKVQSCSASCFGRSSAIRLAGSAKRRGLLSPR